MSKLSQTQLDDLTGLALAICPELANEPLYILAGPEDRRRSKNVSAATISGVLDFRTREELIKANQWKGPGRVILFFGEFEQAQARAVLVHEVGHAVENVVPEEDIEPTPAMKRWQEVSEYVAVRTPEKNCGMPRWFPTHNAMWLRRTLHLHHRAWAAGYEVPLANVVNSESYDLPPAWKFKAALECEFERFADKPFSVIEAEPAPEEFKELFRASQRSYRNACNKNA
jgi:hypothetical protein